jgi:FtsZ-binding cell division protein ZapB
VFSYGVIAQEVEKSGLEVLVDTAEDDRKTVNYTALLCLMIDDLRKKNQALEERVAELEKHNR